VRTRPTIEREFHISWWCIFTTLDHTLLQTKLPNVIFLQLQIAQFSSSSLRSGKALDPSPRTTTTLAHKS
jgi:hypothetical protein